MTSFLLAHCGGGQDKPGSLGPSAECPGSKFFSATFLTRVFYSLVAVFRISLFEFRISRFRIFRRASSPAFTLQPSCLFLYFLYFLYLLYLLYFLYPLYFPPTTGRIFPAAIFSNARSRSFSSPLSKRPSRYSHRRKSSALRSPFSELHSEQLETRLR